MANRESGGIGLVGAIVGAILVIFIAFWMLGERPGAPGSKMDVSPANPSGPAKAPAPAPSPVAPK